MEYHNKKDSAKIVRIKTSILDISRANEVRSMFQKTKSTLKEQLLLRKHILKQLVKFDRFTKNGSHIMKACLKKEIEEKDIINFYTQLILFLKSDPYHVRILLYFPVEYLPYRQWENVSMELTMVIEEFHKTFKESWLTLIETKEFSANFTNGDFLENTSTFSGVIKAFHLLPFMFDVGIVTIEEIIVLLKKTSDSTAIQNIQESLLMITFWYGTDTLRKYSDDVRIQEVLEKYTQRTFVSTQTTFDQNQLEQTRAQVLLLKEEADNADSESRKKWKYNTFAFEKIDPLVTPMVDGFLANVSKSLKHITRFSEIYDDEVSQMIIVICIKQIIEKLVSDSNSVEGIRFFQKFEKIIEKIEQMPANERVRTILETFWHRMYSIQVIDKDTLKKYDLFPIDIFSPKIRKNYSEKLVQYIDEINKHISLKEFIYPICISYGSLIKGYARRNCLDYDIAILVKENVGHENMNWIQNESMKIFNQPVTLFFLESTDGKLKIRDFNDRENFVGTSAMSHVILQGAWIGEEEQIEKLQLQILPHYTDRTERYSTEYSKRFVWFNELERNNLQFRFLHRYYDFFSENRKKLSREDEEYILGTCSAFFDSGYRKKAIRLFLKKVFLP